MATSFHGVFILPWDQTEIDGHAGTLPSALRAGATWRWSGRPLRIDGPSAIMPLGDADGMTDIRLRAGRFAQRLRQAVDVPPIRTDSFRMEGPSGLDQSFSVTDGHQVWIVGVLNEGRTVAAVVQGDLPPPDRDHWVVSVSLDNQTPGFLPKPGVICFTPGTLIRTESADVLVEDLAIGDKVQTKDSGCQEILWIGSRRISGARMHALPALAPVRFRPGALGAGVPEPGLLVSPDHRILLKGHKARAIFGTDEVLVAARDLVNDDSIIVDRALPEVTYIHLMFAHHQIVFANQVETESFHPAGADFGMLEDAQIEGLLAVMPGLAADPANYGTHARRTLRPTEAAILRHGDA